MKVIYYFDESRPAKEKAVVQSIYGNEVQYISERPWSVIDMFESGDFLICSSVDELAASDITLDDIDDIVKEYVNILNLGVELIFDKSTQCNSPFIRALITDDKEFESVLRKCIINYAGQKTLAAKYAKKHVVTAIANGNRVGLKKGTRLITKKSVIMKAKIKELSKEYDGTLSDDELIDELGIARNTYYKYKKQLREEGEEYDGFRSK